MPDYLPTASWANLRLRAGLLRRLREFFHERGFLEVETPVLSADTVVDRHLDPFCVAPCNVGRPKKQFWLQTSPEFGMKRLLAAGGRAIYQVSRVFRQASRAACTIPNSHWSNGIGSATAPAKECGSPAICVRPCWAVGQPSR
jgi:elongation factor P--beta-lysine ligase